MIGHLDAYSLCSHQQHGPIDASINPEKLMIDGNNVGTRLIVRPDHHYILSVIVNRPGYL